MAEEVSCEHYQDCVYPELRDVWWLVFTAGFPTKDFTCVILSKVSQTRRKTYQR